MTIRLTGPQEGGVVSLLTQKQRDFAADEARRAQVSGELTFRWDDLHVEGADDSIPAPVTLCWEPALDDGEQTLEEDDGAGFVPLRRIAVHGAQEIVWNLKTGAAYRWRVSCGGAASGWGTFRTADEAPRWILLDGVSNVRDIGGWKTADGRRIRQGLIYRTGEFDTHMQLTPEGERRLVEELGVRTDLDLRGIDGQGNLLSEAEMRSENGRPVLDKFGVEWVFLPIRPYDAIFKPGQPRDNYARCFEVFADETKYPICFHCWGGADRGGTLALLLEGALGVSREDLVLDYEYTSLAIWGLRTRNYEPFANMMRILETYGPENEPISEKIAAYLREIGVSEATLARLRRNLLV